MVGRYIARKSEPPLWVSNQRAFTHYTTTECTTWNIYVATCTYACTHLKQTEWKRQTRTKEGLFSSQDEPTKGSYTKETYSGKWDTSSYCELMAYWWYYVKEHTKKKHNMLINMPEKKRENYFTINMLKKKNNNIT